MLKQKRNYGVLAAFLLPWLGVGLGSAEGTTNQAETIVEDFNNGLPTQDQGWEFLSTANGTIEVVNGRLEMSGIRHGTDYVSKAIWTVDLAGKTNVKFKYCIV